MANIPVSNVPIPIEAALARSPVSESLIQAIGGAINGILQLGPAVGTVEMSDLSESAFQGIKGTNWVLSDGRSVSGSRYHTLTGLSHVPDRRGTFPRMKDHGRGLDPSGNLAIGTYVADAIGAHTHNFTDLVPSAAAGGSDGGGDNDRGLQGVPSTTASTGGAETRPKFVVINFFVRIN